MRLITILLALGFPAIATINAADENQDKKSTASTQAQVALKYIERLSSTEDIDLAKHTALSKHCSIKRRKDIKIRIDFLKKSYLRKGDQLTVETEKTDNNFAAVLIRADNKSAPLSTRLHAIALVKKENTWKAAPLPGRFSNTGYGYDEKVEQSVKSLELWMAREKTQRETKHRKKATDTFTASLAAIEKKAGLTNMKPEEAVMHWLEQCRDKNLMAILACMGGASDALPDPLKTTISLVTKGLSQEDSENDWHLVTNRSNIAQVLKIDNTRNEVALGFFSPLNRGKSRILYFPFHKVDGKTFVSLSPLLKTALLPKNERWQQRWRHRRGDEDELRKKLPSAIFKNTQFVSHPTPEKLLEHFTNALKQENFTDCVKLIPRTGDYFGKEKNHPIILNDLTTLWLDIHRLKSAPNHTFDIIKNKHVALAPLQYAKINHNSEFQTIKVWMIKDTDGWHLVTTEALHKTLGEDNLHLAEKITKRFKLLEKGHQDKHARSLLNSVVTLTPPITVGPISKDEAKKSFTSYRTHLRSKDNQAALSNCAVLKGTNNNQTLKTFNYATRGVSDHTNYDHICAVTQSGKWTGLTVRTESKLTGLNDYPLYLIVKTEKGPKILLDIDLRHATNRGRELLNKKNWKKLKKILPEESFDDIKTIFDAHNKHTTKDIAEVLKLRE